MKYLTSISKLLKINLILLGYYFYAKNQSLRGERIRLALIKLGPIFIKAGQMLSTRRDLLPDDIANELAKLQDKVPPFSSQIAKQTIEKALGKNIEDVFSEFEMQPLASASIAQVHAVKLLDGRLAVVKVLRPHIRKIIKNDLNLFYLLAKVANRFWPHIKPYEIVNEIATTLYDELDLMREGANASELRRNFQNSDALYVPEIYWPYCRSNVLVMERIDGIPIQNLQVIADAGIDLKKLAERGIEIFFTQVFRDSFFHADMHPGNIFVSRNHLENPQWMVVDFGIVGSLNTKDQRYLAENILAFFKRDYQRVAELHVASGWLPPDTRIDQFEGAIRAVCEPIFERPAKEISFGNLLLRLFQTARRFNINIQPQLILLQKTLVNIEGVCAQIYPDLDMWRIAGPYLEKWVKRQVGPRAFVRRLRDNIPYWSEKLPEMPGLMYEVLTEYKYNLETKRFSHHNRNQIRKNNQHAFYMGFIFACVLLIFLFFLFKF